MRFKLFPILAIWLLMLAPLVQAFDHSDWDALLARHVHPFNEGRATAVDYAAFANEREELQRYLDALSDVTQSEFDLWPVPEQLAFLINAYNAWTVELILTRYPDLTSIREIGSLFSSPWKRRFIPLLGAERSLDEIEHEMIRGSGRYQEPRIHFAVNCASIGCPALRAEAFTADRLEQQLEDATNLFLADESRNRLMGDNLVLSPIFRWYREDFEQGWHGADTLQAFLALYADALSLDQSMRQQLLQKNIRLSFDRYDWSLNDLPR